MTVIWSIAIEHQDMIKWWKNRPLGIKHQFHGMDCQCFPCCDEMKRAVKEGIFYSANPDVPFLKLKGRDSFISYCPWCGKDAL